MKHVMRRTRDHILAETVFIKLMAYENLKAVDRFVAKNICHIGQPNPVLTNEEMDQLTTLIGIWRTQRAALVPSQIWRDTLSYFLAHLPRALNEQPKKSSENYLAWFKRLFDQFTRNRPTYREDVRFLLFDPEEQSVNSGVTLQLKEEMRNYQNVSLEDYCVLNRVMRIMGIWLDQLRLLPKRAVASNEAENQGFD